MAQKTILIHIVCALSHPIYMYIMLIKNAVAFLYINNKEFFKNHISSQIKFNPRLFSQPGHFKLLEKIL